MKNDEAKLPKLLNGPIADEADWEVVLNDLELAHATDDDDHNNDDVAEINPDTLKRDVLFSNDLSRNKC